MLSSRRRTGSNCYCRFHKVVLYDGDGESSDIDIETSASCQCIYFFFNLQIYLFNRIHQHHPDSNTNFVNELLNVILLI